VGLKVSALREDAEQREARTKRGWPWWGWFLVAAPTINLAFRDHGWSLAIDLAILAALPIVIAWDSFRRQRSNGREG